MNPPRQPSQLLMPLVLLLLGAAIVWHVNTVFAADGATHTGPLDDSGLFPRIIGYALIGLSAITLVQHTFGMALGGDAEDVDGVRANRLRAIAVLGVMILYVGVLRWLGYAIATPLMLVAACLILQCRVVWAVFLAVVGSLVMSLIFERVLNVQLPLGTLF